MSGHPQDEVDGVCELLPRVRLRVELPAAGPCELVELRAPVIVGRAPLRADPSLAFETMQCRVQRPLRDLECLAGHLVNSLGDRPAMLRRERERFEDQEVERSLRQIESIGHGFPLCFYKTIYSTCRSARGE